MGVGGNPGFRFSGDRRASPTRFGPHAQIPTRPQSAGGSGSCRPPTNPRAAVRDGMPGGGLRPLFKFSGPQHNFRTGYEPPRAARGAAGAYLWVGGGRLRTRRSRRHGEVTRLQPGQFFLVQLVRRAAASAPANACNLRRNIDFQGFSAASAVLATKAGFVSARWNGSPSRTNPSKPRVPVLKFSTRGIFSNPPGKTAWRRIGC
jgi:hypothetical protein